MNDTKPMTTADIGVTLKYFEYKDLPARQLAPNRLPEIYRPKMGWLPLYDTFDFVTHCTPVDEVRIKEMIAHLENAQPQPAA